MKGINNLETEIINIFNKYLGDDYLLFVFGSFARNNGTRASDIDLAVYKESLSIKTILEIKEELEEKVHTLRNIDLINLKEDISADLLANILKEGVIWQKPRNLEEILKNLKRRLENIKK